MDPLIAFDARRDFIIPGDKEQTINWSAHHFVKTAFAAIEDHGFFAVALSGGSTPKAIYKKLASFKEVPWEKVYLFWSDERAAPPDHDLSNYKMAMESAFSKLPILHIYRMQAEETIDENAKVYEQHLKETLYKDAFDLTMLGMGEDGHTASLFPKTHALHSQNRWVVPNYIPEKEVWRMTLTFPCINASRNIAVYVLGEEKAPIVKQVFTEPYNPDLFPIQKIGTEDSKALFIFDNDAFGNLD